MEAAFLEAYRNELRFLREMAVEYARAYPQVAKRLNLPAEVTECEDPYVERLLEGFAFLTARVQHKMSAEFPRFTQHLLESVYPHYLAPTPSMTVVRIEPDLSGGVTEEGYELPRHTELRSPSVVKGRANCEFRTAHAIKLWPLQIAEVRYLTRGDAGRFAADGSRDLKAAIRLRLESSAGIQLQSLDLDELPLYLHGSGSLPFQLYELLLAHTLDIVVSQEGNDQLTNHSLGQQGVTAMGFNADESLLPVTPRGFSGYRVLHEYFSLPQRFLFVKLQGLRPALKRCTGTSLDIVFLLDQAHNSLEDIITRENFQLYCTPAINLFEKRTDRVFLNHRSTEYHLVVDKTRPRDYEVHSVSGLTGYGSGSQSEQTFEPFYTARDGFGGSSKRAYYSIRRRPKLVPDPTQKSSADYQGSELYLSLVDSHEAPYSSNLKQLGAEVLCTNRDLPQLLVMGQGNTDFSLTIGAPVNAVRCLVPPSKPKASAPEGDTTWRLINHLTLNYLTLIDEGEEKGAHALRELLRLYADFSDPTIVRQIDGVVSVTSEQVVRRIPIDGPMAFARGMEIKLELDDKAFEGAGAFLLSAVLERFFSKYVSINSFTQTVVQSRDRGEIMRWPVRSGNRTLM